LRIRILFYFFVLGTESPSQAYHGKTGSNQNKIIINLCLVYVHVFGEAIEIMDGVVAAANNVDGGHGRVPVSGNDENGSGPLA
jgi:hypothetical protein